MTRISGAVPFVLKNRWELEQMEQHSEQSITERFPLV